MAIIFVKEKKKQRVLIAVFFFIVIVIALVLWQGFFKKEIPAFPEEILWKLPREIKINFEIFEKTEELQSLTEIEPFRETKGRENPFLPY